MARKTRDAKTAHDQNLSMIQTLLGSISKAADQNAGADKVDWNHVGTLANVREQLEEVHMVITGGYTIEGPEADDKERARESFGADFVKAWNAANGRS